MTATGPNQPVWPVWVPAALLLMVVIFTFWPATGHDFVNYDDPAYVTKNLHVQGGLNWDGVEWAFTHTVVGNWHPVTVLSQMMDCQLFGLRPWGHHLSSVLLHGLNTVLVFLLLCRLTGAMWRSLMVAALFGLHPLHVESVAWVAERKDVLSAFFGLLGLIAYAHYAQGKRESSAISSSAPFEFLKSPFYWLSLLLFTLGLMSKPMLVTMPSVMLLLDYWPLNRMRNAESGMRNFARLLPEKIPFFLLAAMMSVVTCLAQQHGGMMDSLENVPAPIRVENALISYCRYLEKLFWPAQLAVFYPYPNHWPLYQALLAGGVLAVISAAAYALRARRPWLLMGWLWFCGMLVPVIGLVQVGGQAMADRYTYLPSLGLFMMVVWGVGEAVQAWKYHAVTLWGLFRFFRMHSDHAPTCCAAARGATRRWQRHLPSAPCSTIFGSWGMGCAVILACIGLTRQQLGYWQDSETLYRHTLAVTEDNYLAHHNLGIFLFSKGRTDEAIAQYREALRVRPDSSTAHYDLGAALGKKGETDEAIIEFKEALQGDPGNTDARINLGIALAAKGRAGEAIDQFQEAIRLQPDNAEAHYDLGAMLGRQGQLDEAIAQFREAIRIQPDYTAARLNLAHALEIKDDRTGSNSQ